MRVCAVLVCVCLCVCARAQPRQFELGDAAALFENFTRTHNKLYPTEEEREKRFNIFKETLKIINEKNSKRKFDHQAFYGITKFADLSAEERLPMGLLEEYRRDGGRGCSEGAAGDAGGAGDLPERLDWRERGKVTSVKNQGHCGSCWAFSAVGNIESQIAIKYSKLLDLSEQQLVDCDDSSRGCCGGLPQRGLISVIKKGGIELEKDYPYEEKNQQCSFNQSKAKVQLKGCTVYRITDELNQLKSILNTVGPVSIGLTVSDDAWKHYTGGIMSLEECPAGFNVNHAVVLVGYGVEGGVPYWIVKNSWGEAWGDRGYIRLSAGHNTCNLISQQVSNALV